MILNGNRGECKLNLESRTGSPIHSSHKCGKERFNNLCVTDTALRLLYNKSGKMASRTAPPPAYTPKRSTLVCHQYRLDRCSLSRSSMSYIVLRTRLLIPYENRNPQSKIQRVKSNMISTQPWSIIVCV